MADGSVIFPAAGLGFTASGNIAEQQLGFMVAPTSDLTGSYNPISGQLNLAGTMSSTILPFTGTVSFNVVGQATARRPIANAGPDQSLACGGGPVTVNGGQSLDPDGDAITYAWSDNGTVLANTKVATVTLSTGVHDLLLTVTDSTQRRGLDFVRVAVTPDAVPPVLTAPANKTVSICTDSATVAVGQATATDNCVSSLVPTGKVISTNGVTLVPPTPVVGGQVALKVGTSIVQWTAFDGVNTVTANQTVVVGSTIQASQSFLVDDRGQVQNATGGFGAILNSGVGSTRLGQDGRSGAILSKGPVTIQHRSIVSGNVVSGSTVTKDSDATVNGTITTNGTVVLPALPTLPAFPAPMAGGFTVNSGVTLSRPPGSYSAATVLNGGTLILAAGDYFFQSLTINASSTVRATPTTRIFTRDTLIFNAPIRGTSGTALQAIFLGFAGANLSLTAQFNGTLVAPNANVIFGTGAGVTYRGSFFGRILEVTPGSTLVCSVN
jgi:hypothetical protein